MAAITGSPESGKHARINILAITVITDWQDSRPHTDDIVVHHHASGTEDQTDELPLFRSPVIPRALTRKMLQQPSSPGLALLTGYSPYL